MNTGYWPGGVIKKKKKKNNNIGPDHPYTESAFLSDQLNRLPWTLWRIGCCGCAHGSHATEKRKTRVYTSNSAGGCLGKLIKTSPGC